MLPTVPLLIPVPLRSPAGRGNTTATATANTTNTTSTASRGNAATSASHRADPQDDDDDDDDGRQHFLQCLSSYLLTQSNASSAPQTRLGNAKTSGSHHSGNGNGNRNTCSDDTECPSATTPTLSELLPDLRRLLDLRSRLANASMGILSIQILINQDTCKEYMEILGQYAALLGVLLNLGVGAEEIPELPLSWSVITDLPALADQDTSTMDMDMMEIDGSYSPAYNASSSNPSSSQPQPIKSVDGEDISVTSFAEERRLAVYALAAMEHWTAVRNVRHCQRPLETGLDRSASGLIGAVLGGARSGGGGSGGSGGSGGNFDVARARTRLKDAQNGFGRSASLFEHLRTSSTVGTGSSSTAYSNGGTATPLGGSTGSGRRLSLARSSRRMHTAMRSSASNPIDAPTMHLFSHLSLSCGQVCVYGTALVQKNQMPSVLARLAAGCADWFDKVADCARVLVDPDDVVEGGAAGGGGGSMRSMGSSGGGGVGGNDAASPDSIRRWMADKAQIRATFQASAYYYTALAHYHEACFAHAKKYHQALVGRNDIALEYVGRAEVELLNHKLDIVGGVIGDSREYEQQAVALLAAGGRSTAVKLPMSILAQIIALHSTVSGMRRAAETVSYGIGAIREDATTANPIFNTRGQNMMKSLPPIASGVDLNCPNRAAESLDPPPLPLLLDADGVQVCREFDTNVRKILEEAKATARHATDVAKEELGQHSLPDSVMTFKATVEVVQASKNHTGNQNGIPPTMATRIESVHSSSSVTLLKQNLYILQEVAELARQNLNEVEKILDDTTKLDSEFRTKHPSFRGREVDAEHAKITLPSFEGGGKDEVGAREMVSKCRSWLEMARRGDQKLTDVLDEFETDAKYKLIMLPLNKLEKLVSGGVRKMSNAALSDDEMETNNGLNNSVTSFTSVDTTALESAISQLDEILNKRDQAVASLEREMKGYKMRPRLVRAIEKEATRDEDGTFTTFYTTFTNDSYAQFNENLMLIDDSIKQQQGLLSIILQLNDEFKAGKEVFEKERQRSGNSLRTSQTMAYLEKIASALQTIEWIQPQLIQGRNFYQTVLQHIDELKKKVSDTNAVLASERIFYEDSYETNKIDEMRRQQEEEDEQLARELAAAADASAAAAAAPVAPPDLEQMQRDEEMAADLARQFEQEANVRDRTHQAPVPAAAPEAEATAIRQVQRRSTRSLSSISGDADNTPPPPAGRAVDAVEPMAVQPAPTMGNARGAEDEKMEEDEAEGDDVFPDGIPRTIFAQNTRRRTSDQLSLISNVSSIGNGSVVRNRQHEIIREREQQNQQDRREREQQNQQDRREGQSRPQEEENIRNTSQEDGQDLIMDDEQPIHEPWSRNHSREQPSRDPLPGRSRAPGVVQMRNDEEPEVQVNDEAFAQLIAMDFEPAIVSDALRRFDNNQEMALDYILSQMS